MTPENCARCKKPMRPTRTTPEQAPGTVRIGASGNCESCTRTLRAIKAAEEPKAVARFVTITTRVVEEPKDWQAYALCMETDPDAFFPEKGAATTDPKKTCFACESRTKCLEYALENNEEFGIWGGLTAYERKKLRRTRAAA